MESVSKTARTNLRVSDIAKIIEDIDYTVYVFRFGEFKFAYVNNAAAKFAGLDAEHIIGKTTSEISCFGDHDKVNELYSQASSGPVQSISFESEHLDLNSEIVPVEISSHLIHPADGQPFVVNISRDISARKTAEKTRSEFMTTIIHELRTPLTSIKGALGLIQSGATGELSENTKILIDISYRNSENLIRIIGDLLDIEKAKVGKINYHLENIDLAELIEDSVQLNQNYADKFGVSFQTSGTDTPFLTDADYGRVLQMMANFLSNSAKFSKEGDIVLVSLSRNDATARISVKDKGSGIPNSAQTEIFDPFTQAGSPAHNIHGGAGLGLGIAKSIAEAHGWKISFKSHEGEGSEFLVDIPT